MKRSLLVFTEGRITEEGYLNFYRKKYRTTVTVEVSDFHGTPLSLVKAAIQEKTANEKLERRGRGTAHEEVWCVFDTDQHPHLDQAFELADQHGIKVAVSCPCIELWFLLHFADQTAYIETKDAQAKSKDHINCRKALTDTALDTLDERYNDAKSRAQHLDTKHRGDATPAPANPSSSVWRLIDAISRQSGP